MEINTELLGKSEKVVWNIIKQEVTWQSLIYELVNTEQLDPWDIDIVRLTNAFIERIKHMEEANLHISSKLLLVASILIRIKTEMLHKQLIIIEQAKQETKQNEKIEIDLDELPILIPNTPLPRARKITLNELIEALSKAIQTEEKRVRKNIRIKSYEQQLTAVLPRVRINLKEKIKQIYEMIKTIFRKKQVEKINFIELSGQKREDKIATFVPLLHLDFQNKIELIQEKPFDDIFIKLKK